MKNSQLRKENPCPPIPPPVKVKETEVITKKAMITTLRRALSFYSSIQAHDGHWLGESAGPLFFLQPFLCIFLTIVYKCMFILYCIFLSLRYYWYSFRYGVNLHVLLMFFALLNNSAKQQKLRDPSGGPLRCLN